MRLLTETASLIAFASSLTLATARHGFDHFSELAARQQQDANTPLFLDEPSCDSYQCSVTWHPGDTATSHWLNAPPGNVQLELLTNASSVSYTKIAIVPGVTSSCQAEKGKTCGQFRWIVPSAWVGGNFTLRASSVNDPKIDSYTDVILVKDKDDAPKDAPPVQFKTLDPLADGVPQPRVIGADPSASSNSTASAPSGNSDAKTAVPAASTVGTVSNATSSAPAAQPKAAASAPQAAAKKNGVSAPLLDGNGPLFAALLALLASTFAVYL